MDYLQYVHDIYIYTMYIYIYGRIYMICNISGKEFEVSRCDSFLVDTYSTWVALMNGWTLSFDVPPLPLTVQYSSIPMYTILTHFWRILPPHFTPVSPPFEDFFFKKPRVAQVATMHRLPNLQDKCGQGSASLSHNSFINDNVRIEDRPMKWPKWFEACFIMFLCSFCFNCKHFQVRQYWEVDFTFLRENCEKRAGRIWEDSLDPVFYCHCKRRVQKSIKKNYKNHNFWIIDTPWQWFLELFMFVACWYI